ncbi:glutathione S-transferase family protein [Nitratireductor pacificus]|uniref:glutathione transferase n=1 Tax=Nitratireductor pacificus pht-3B TaxID=391937 RepID=K2MJ54_9HYPH|nr:glutathione S-transferase family protein [Nitratireductor pacificus]EKF20725.1 glutathione S-transferase [Nitratireductor pacificus pht-3B]
MAEKPILISFDLCPYVQRAAIVLAEKNVAFERIDVDLSNKPDWFLKISPLGKVPVLQVGGEALFESAAIVEYLDETEAPRLHPADPLTRARHRAWMEVGSSILSDIWTMETTHDRTVFGNALTAIGTKLKRVEAELGDGPYFAGTDFTVVDAVFAPAFRYFDVFDTIADFGVFDGLPKVVKWREALAERPSVREAVIFDYEDRLRRFLEKQGGVILDWRKAA